MLASYLSPLMAEDFLSDTTLDDLLNLEITVASGAENKLTTRQSPSVVAVLTREDIEATGASNLLQLLRFVPGFDYTTAESGINGFQVRGNYASEGKLLVNYNGVPANEASFGAPSFSGFFNLDIIERIEIIRGPGSALYGGAAELGVVNVITKDMRGKGMVGVSTNRTNESAGYFTSSLSAGIGSESPDDFDANVYLGFAEENTGEGPYYGYDGTLFQKSENYFLRDNHFIIINAAVSDLTVDLHYHRDRQNFPLAIYDRVSDNGNYDYINDVGRITYSSLFGQVQYRYQLFEHTILTAKLQYGDYDSAQSIEPYTVLYPEWYYDVPVDRIAAEFSFNERPFGSDDFSIDAGYGFFKDGVEFSEQQIQILLDEFGLAQNRVVATTDYDTHYFYLQSLLKLGNFTLTGGFRTEDNEIYGNVTVPRFAVTYVNGPFHTKIMASKAYKAPTPGTLGLSFEGELEPEEAEVFELEVGYRVTENSFAQVNIFDNTLEDVIVYDDDDVLFSNGGTVHTRGTEIEYRVQDDWGFAAINYSRYWIEENTVADYQAFSVSADNLTFPPIDKLFGSPQTMITLYAKLKFNERLSLNPSAVYLGERYSIRYIDNAANVETRLPSEVIANLHLQYDDLFIEGFSGSIGAYNLSDSDNTVANGYIADETGHAPGLGRRLDIKFKFVY